MASNRSYSAKTLKIVWARSGNTCAYPGCTQILVVGNVIKKDFTVIGDMAHIVAHNIGGPRGYSRRGDKLKNSPSNIILLCPTHHRLVDQDPQAYSSDLLAKWKEDHELAVVDTMLGPRGPNLCERLRQLLEFTKAPLLNGSAGSIKINFRSEKLNRNWEYSVRSDTKCGELAEALAEQHFHPLHKSIKWVLADDEGKPFPDNLTLNQAGINDYTKLLLLTSHFIVPLDPAAHAPPIWYSSREFHCTGDFLKYIPHWEAYTAEKPNDVSLLNTLAWMYLEANTEIERADQLLHRIPDLDPKFASNYAFIDNCGWLDYRRGDFHTAEFKLRQSLDIIAKQKDDPDTESEYFTILYHLYFAWKRLSLEALADVAWYHIHSWWDVYGVNMLLRNRVAKDDDSLLIPSAGYCSPEWNIFFGLCRDRPEDRLFGGL